LKLKRNSRELLMNKPTTRTETNLVNQCYEQIQDNIIDGTFTPGKKLKVKELKLLLKTGHSPIREALSRLATSGLVEAHDNKGFRVTKISESDIRDIYHTFLHIELLALTQAMKLGDDSWKASIVAALYSLSLIENDETLTTIPYQIWYDRNYAFHVALISGCNSPTLLRIRSDLYLRFDRYCRMSFTIAKLVIKTNHEEHKKLAQAALDRDHHTAHKLMTHHLLGSLEDVVKLFKKNNLF